MTLDDLDFKDIKEELEDEPQYNPIRFPNKLYSNEDVVSNNIMKKNNVSFKQNFPPKSCDEFDLRNYVKIFGDIQRITIKRSFVYRIKERSCCINFASLKKLTIIISQIQLKCQKNISQNIITLNNIEDLYKNESKNQSRVSQKGFFKIHSCKSKENQIKNDPQLNAIFNINNINSLHRDHILLIYIIRSEELDHSIRNE